MPDEPCQVYIDALMSIYNDARWTATGEKPCKDFVSDTITLIQNVLDIGGDDDA